MLEQRPDISDPRLAESETRYQAVIENASDMIQSVRMDGTFEFVNPAWHRKLGFTAEDLPNMTIWDIIHPDSIDHCMVAFGAVMQGNSMDEIRAIFITKDGRAVPVEGSATVRMVDGEVIATHSFFRDISERLHALELEERNAQLEREQLARYLEKMAALGKLSAGLAHELNNPAAAAQRASSQLLESLAEVNASVRALTRAQLAPDQHDPFAVLADAGVDKDADESGVHVPGHGTLSPIEISTREEAVGDWLLARQIGDAWSLAPTLVHAGIMVAQLEELAYQLPPSALAPVVRCMGGTLAARDLAGAIASSTRRISELVTAIKAYSYMDRSLEQEVDIHDGLEDTLIILAHRLTNNTVVRDYDRTLPRVCTLGSALNQVWTNILDNAVDATNGTGTITIRTRRSGDHAVVEIGDDGSGIPEDVLTRIFEPFFTTKPQGQGIGLGLDTAWRIVTEQHRGTIEVESLPGNTLFRVLLPTQESA